MSRILWIGDAGTTTGFGRVAEEIGGRLVTDFGHEVHALAVMWDASYPYDGPLKLYRANSRGSFLGYDRVPELLELIEPDVVICNEDLPQFRHRLLENPYDPGKALLNAQPVLGYIPVDGYNVPPSWKDLAQQVNIVAYTEFGAQALGIDRWVHHAVDTSVFHPVDEDHPLTIGEVTLRSKAACREFYGIPQDDFVVGRVDTNTGRKDWGSTFRVLEAAYALGLDPTTVVAAFHTKLREPSSGMNLPELLSRGSGKYMVTNSSSWPVEKVVAMINCFSVFLTTSRGEGWGLTPAEAMACGVPVIATDCSSFTEVVGPGGVLVPPKAYMTNPYGVDQVLADVQAMAGQLVLLARNPDRRAELAAAGLGHIRQFSWDVSARAFHNFIEALISAAQSRVTEGGQLTEA